MRPRMVDSSTEVHQGKAEEKIQFGTRRGRGTEGLGIKQFGQFLISRRLPTTDKGGGAWSEH